MPYLMHEVEGEKITKSKSFIASNFFMNKQVNVAWLCTFVAKKNCLFNYGVQMSSIPF